MKIAIITNTTYETIIPLAKSISKQCSVEVFTIISSRGSGKAILFENEKLWFKEKPSLVLDILNKSYVGELFSTYIQNTFQLNAIYLKSLAYLNWFNYYPYFQLIKYLKKRKFDIIHINIETPLLILLKLLFPKKGFIVTIHDPIPHSGEDDYQRKILRIYLNRRTKLNYLFHSQFSLKQFNQYYPKAISELKKIVPFGPHQFLLKYKDANIKPYKGSILFFGRISPYKGLNYLIEGYKIAKKELNYLNLTIAGQGSLLVTDVQLEGEDIRIMNQYIPNELLCKLIQESEIVICPYIDATQSGVVMTAMTFGKPVLATNVGAMSEIIKHKHNGYLIQPCSSQEISNALVEIFQDTLLLSNMKKASEEYYAKGISTWDFIGQQTIEYYCKIIK